MLTEETYIHTNKQLLIKEIVGKHEKVKLRFVKIYIILLFFIGVLKSPYIFNTIYKANYYGMDEPLNSADAYNSCMLLIEIQHILKLFLFF